MIRSRFIKDEPREDPRPSQAEVRRAKDFFSDVFVDAILAQIDEQSAGRGLRNAQDIVNFASEVAARALEEMEKRWPKI